MGLSYYKPGYRATRKMKDTDITLSADMAWSAAAYADRLNGGEYRKEPEYLVLEDGRVTNDVVRQPNKIYMWQAIMDTSIITEEDRHVGRQAHDWVRKNLVIKGLKNSMSDFDRALAGAVEQQEFNTGSDRYELALITSQIRAWREGTRMEAVMENVVLTPVAAVGDKVHLSVQVIKCLYSTNYNVYFITAKTDGNQMVLFSYRERKPVGQWMTIRGTVKAHRDHATQLNRVKMV